MRRIAATALLAFGLLAAAGAQASMDSDKLLAVGNKAPAFTFAEVASGGAMTMDVVAHGRPHLLVFLQTACQSCFRGMQTLKQLRAGGAEIEILGIFLDMKAKDFQKYIGDNELPFVFGWDSNYSIAEAYGVSFTPASFLLDQDRNVTAVYRGFHAGIEQALKADLAKLTRK